MSDQHAAVSLAQLAGELDLAVQQVLALGARALAAAPQRLSSSQLQALLVIDQAGSVNLAQLADAMRLIPSSATRLCQRLVAADLVNRETNVSDRREAVLSLTATGDRLVSAVREHRLAALTTVLARYDERERRAVLRGLSLLSRELAAPAEQHSTARRDCLQ